MKRILSFLFLFLAGTLLSLSALAAGEEPAFNGYLVRMENGPRPSKAAPGGALGGGLYYAETPEEAEALSELGTVLYCEPNYILTVEDWCEGYVPTQWNLLSTGAAAAWEHTDSFGLHDRMGDGVTVAVVDTGVMADHPDLLHADILETLNLSTDPDGLDNYHGTFIAGILAAEINNGIGTDGITPGITILPVCVTWEGGKTDVKTAVQGIRLAADSGADVISFSIGGPNESAALREACEYAVDCGSILVASAGNYRSGEPHSEDNYLYPAAYDCVIAVSACRQTSDGVEFDSDYSYFNDAVDVSAPGTGIVSLYLDGGTVTKNGTSFAAPAVAAMAAMARQADPSLDKDGFLQLLEASSVDLGSPGYDVCYGFGYVSVPAFLEALDDACSPAPKITLQPESAVAAVQTGVSFTVAASGEGLSYQWQYKSKSSSVWSNAAGASGRTAEWSLTVAAVHYGFDFRCVVSNAEGYSTATAVFHIDPPVVITAQPSDRTAAAGTAVTVSVEAVGAGLAYRWQYKSKSSSVWSDAVGASGRTADWTLRVSEVHYGFDFRCVVTDAAGYTAVTDVFHIDPPFVITVQPSDRNAAVGTPLVLSVEASGTGLTYQWQYRNKSSSVWSNAAGASGRTADWHLTVAAVHYGFDFRCAVTDADGHTAVTNVFHIDPPVVITAQPSDRTAAVGTPLVLSVEASGTGLTYQWQYRNRSSSVWSNAAGASGRTADWHLTVAAVHYGFDFRCVVTDADGHTAVTNVFHIDPPVVITAQPSDRTAAVGTPLVLSVEASGTGLTYQWQYRNRPSSVWSNAVGASGRTADWHLTAAAVHYGFDFRCVVTDADGYSAVTDPFRILPE